jgi:putative FmdB family regulatory protein
MLYDYECTNCGEVLDDVFQKGADAPLTLCPACNTNRLERIVTGGLYASVRNVSTIGQLAEYNTKRAGGRLEEERVKQLEENPPKQDKPWFTEGAPSRKEINKMTKEKQKKYIMTGEK